jgi:hypothetical protein
MELNDFVTGERLQGLADVSIIPLGTGIGEKECDFVKTQQQNNNYNTFYYTENTNDIPDYVLNSKILFVNTWTFDKFFKVIFPKLKNKHIFISHNSDISFDNKYVHFLNDEKVIKWFSQNVSIKHNKLYSLPIGLGNQQYPHGNLNLVKSILEQNNIKDILVFKNFNINTNRLVRVICEQITSKNNIPLYSGQTQIDYFKHVACSKFVISPPGNGPDCHRVWECLYFKTVPVVQYHECFNQFSHLPILFINNWEDVTLNFLEEKYSLIKEKFNHPIKELSIQYWKEKICSG